MTSRCVLDRSRLERFLRFSFHGSADICPKSWCLSLTLEPKCMTQSGFSVLFFSGTLIFLF